MGICLGNDDFEDWAFKKGHCALNGTKKNNNTERNVPEKSIPLIKKEINYAIPYPITREEMLVNMKIDYIMHGLEYDLFPANYRRNGKRWSWGVGTHIPSDTMLLVDVFAFDNTLKSIMDNVIKYSKSLKGNYGDSSPPQLILNYQDGKFILNVECYTRNGEMYMCRSLQSPKNTTRMYLRTIIEEGQSLYDLNNPEATYEN